MFYEPKSRAALAFTAVFTGSFPVFRHSHTHCGTGISLYNLPYYWISLPHVRHDACVFKRHAFCFFTRHFFQSADSAHFSAVLVPVSRRRAVPDLRHARQGLFQRFGAHLVPHGRKKPRCAKGAARLNFTFCPKCPFGSGLLRAPTVFHAGRFAGDAGPPPVFCGVPPPPVWAAAAWSQKGRRCPAVL